STLANYNHKLPDYQSHGINPRSSGNGPAIGTSNSGPGPSGSMVSVPSAAKNTPIWLCAPTAAAATGGVPPMLVRKVCGFLPKPTPSANARSLRKNVARSARSPERISAVAVGLGTVLSPRANWIITGFARSPGRGDLFTNGAQATGSPACPSHRLVSSTV